VAEDHFGKIEKLIEAWLGELKGGVMPNNPEAKYWNFYEWTPGLDGSQIIDGAQAFGQDPPELHACKTLFFLEALEAYRDICRFLGKEPITSDAVAGLFRNRLPTHADDVFSELTQALSLRYLSLSSAQHDLLRAAVRAGHLLHPASLGMKIYQFEALDCLLQDDGKHSLEIIREEWGIMLAQGATSFWETLKGDADFDGAGSLCHGWASLPAYYLFAEILGIKPLEPGFRKFSVSPKFAPMGHIQGSIPTPAGEIRAQWSRDGSGIRVVVEYPIGIEPVPGAGLSSATVIPQPSAGKVVWVGAIDSPTDLAASGL
jgi:hypothetical protein